MVTTQHARDWHSVVDIADPFDHPGLLADPLEEVLAMLPDGVPSERVELYVARRDGKPVGAAKLQLPMADNTKLGVLALTVLPTERRQGVGRELFEAMRHRMGELGRETVTGIVGAPDDSEAAGNRFAIALGATEALSGIRYELPLVNLDEDLLHALEHDASVHSHGYGLVQWIDRAPDHLVDDWAVLVARVQSDSPQGERHLEDERWDADRCREWEGQTIARGRARLLTAASDLDSGHLVAATDLTINRSRPAIAYQWDTIVAPEHRGHRLGLRVKIANIWQLRRVFPATQKITTWNAAANSFMRSVNEAIGFREVERFTEWQVRNP